MSEAHICYVACSSGEAGSEMKTRVNNLVDLIIKPALEASCFDIIRRDQMPASSEKDKKTRNFLDEADVCIFDLGASDMNVIYELGWRDRSGKMTVLLKPQKNEVPLADLAGREFIEYDLLNQGLIRKAVAAIQKAVNPIVSGELETQIHEGGLDRILPILERVEQKLDQSLQKPERAVQSPLQVPVCEDPKEYYRAAILLRNIPMAETALEQLRKTVDTYKWLSQYVGPLAALGSTKAGSRLFSHAEEFMETSRVEGKDKVSYLSDLLEYAKRSDQKAEIVDEVKRLTSCLEEPQRIADAENQTSLNYLLLHQKSHLLFELYKETGDISDLRHSVDYAKGAYDIYKDDAGICYKLAWGCFQFREYAQAKTFIDQVLSLEEAPSSKSLELAAKIFFILGDARFSDIFAQLERTDPVRAIMLSKELERLQ